MVKRGAKEVLGTDASAARCRQQVQLHLSEVGVRVGAWLDLEMELDQASGSAVSALSTGGSVTLQDLSRSSVAHALLTGSLIGAHL